MIDINSKEVQAGLRKLRESGNSDVLSTGSWQLDNHVRLLRGYPWFFGGQPHHGKTEVVMELLVKWSKLYGWKHYCYFGEGGDVFDIVADLCSKIIGKSYHLNAHTAMSESERMYAETFVQEHFYFADPDKKYTFDTFYQEVSYAEKHYGVKFDTTVLDPFNDLEYDLTKYSNISYWLKDVLRDIRVISKVNKRVDIVVVHVAETQVITDRDTGLQYNPPALPSQWEGGKIWNRRAFVQIGVYLNKEKQTELIVHKAKPKQVKVYVNKDEWMPCRWSWDWQKNRYFENAGDCQHYILEKFADQSNREEYKTKIEPPDDDLPF